jgi:hypothetical protein
MAAASRAAGQSALALGNDLFAYACKIEETANGSRRGARGQAREAFKIIFEGRFAEHVQINEQSGAAQNGQDQAQRKTDQEKAALRRDRA